MSDASDRKPGDKVSADGRGQPQKAPRLSDDGIRAMVDDAVRRDRLWIVAEFMETTMGEPRWNYCWVALERAMMTVWHVKGARLISYIAREFMPPDTPHGITNLVLDADAWMAKRLNDRRGHELARQRMELWQQRRLRKLKPGGPPTTPVERDAPERVLADYPRLAAEGGLTLTWTRPAMAVLLALPLHALKAALAGLVELYAGASPRTTLVTLGALRQQLRNLRP